MIFPFWDTVSIEAACRPCFAFYFYICKTEKLFYYAALYFDRFYVRYFELRSDILSTEKLIARYFDFIDSIPTECYEKELELYPDSPQNSISQKEQISNFLTARCKALDTAMNTIHEVTK
jgi:hypothetical protein